ncbi:MAG: hypothetical protein Athens071426_157 [Parcubacteria group bacterium Athens0714_26]|nr:MAG: hypothetical protein Athens071426_157 [Parcubacteria group bacterium Athens0714_26]
MAIILEEKKSFSWGTFLIIILIFSVIVGGAYFLFFAPKPAIEVLVPRDQKITSELSKADFNPSVLANSETFKLLRKYPGAPSVSGKTGRVNPFIKY